MEPAAGLFTLQALFHAHVHACGLCFSKCQRQSRRIIWHHIWLRVQALSRQLSPIECLLLQSASTDEETPSSKGAVTPHSQPAPATFPDPRAIKLCPRTMIAEQALSFAKCSDCTALSVSSFVKYPNPLRHQLQISEYVGLLGFGW